MWSTAWWTSASTVRHSLSPFWYCQTSSCLFVTHFLLNLFPLFRQRNDFFVRSPQIGNGRYRKNCHYARRNRYHYFSIWDQWQWYPFLINTILLLSISCSEFVKNRKALPQSRQANFHIFPKRKRGTGLSSQKDGCRRNGLNTGFSSPLSICSC